MPKLFYPAISSHFHHLLPVFDSGGNLLHIGLIDSAIFVSLAVGWNNSSLPQNLVSVNSLCVCANYIFVILYSIRQKNRLEVFHSSLYQMEDTLFIYDI